MKRATAEEILKDPERFAHHDRIFLNNPVVMQGMGLAPLVVVATNAQNALMLALAVALLLTPTRVLASLLTRRLAISEEPTPRQMQSVLLPRCLIYCACAAVVYIPVYCVLNFVFGVELLSLGIYLPMLAVEPIIIYRFGRVPEGVKKAASKGLRITLGYALLLVVTGCGREWLAAGTVFGVQLGRYAFLPLAGMPAGGLVLLGVLFALWRAAAQKYKNYLKTEAHSLAAVQRQKEASAEQ